MKTLFRIAFRNVRLNWRHSLAAVLSIVASFFSLVIFEGYMKNISEMYYDGYRNRAMYGDFIIENQNVNSVSAKSEPWKFYLTRTQQDQIEQFLRKHESEIFDHVKLLNLQGMVTNGKTSTIFIGHGHSVQSGARIRKHWAWNTLYGTPLYKSTLEHPILLGQTLGRTLGCQPVKKENVMSSGGGYIASIRPYTCLREDIQLSLITEGGQLNAMDFTVAGLEDSGYQEIDGKFVSMSIEDAQTLLHTDKISSMTLEVNEGVDKAQFLNAFNTEVGSREPDLRLIRWQDHPRVGELYIKTMSLLAIFRNFVVVVILSISILSVMNTMVKIIKERTREVGTLRSLGFQKIHILLIFILESIFLALLGTGLGLVISPLTTLGINSLGILYRAGLLSEPVIFGIKISVSDYIFVTLMLVLISSLTTALSLRSTLSRKIIDCLQHS